jgi:hypothetical protein
MRPHIVYGSIAPDGIFDAFHPPSTTSSVRMPTGLPCSSTESPNPKAVRATYQQDNEWAGATRVLRAPNPRPAYGDGGPASHHNKNILGSLEHVSSCLVQQQGGTGTMNSVIYLIGFVVVVLVILSFLGLN